MSHTSHKEGGHSMGSDMHYMHLGIMLVLNFIAMYILMYAMVNVFGNVYSSVNQFYMAGLMTAPMTFLEILIMRGMYKNKKWNLIIGAGGVIALLLFFLAIRAQTAIGDVQFLRSMIPHHAGAILMCEKASIQDPEIKELCAGIISGQQQEIEQMKAILERIK